MYKTQKAFHNTVRCFCYLSAVFQALLGTVWAVKNFAVYFPTQLSENYIQASKSLIVDDYMGILYAIFLRCFSFAGNEKGISLEALYFVQFVLVAACVYALINAIYANRIRFADKIALVSLVAFNPLVMQLVRSVNDRALIVPLLLSFAAGLYAFIDTKKMEWCGIAAFSGCALTFTNKDIGVFLILFLIIISVCNIKTGKKEAMICAIIAALVLFSFVACQIIAQPYAYGRGMRGLWTLLVQRVVWPDVKQFKVELQTICGLKLEYADDNATRSVGALFSEYFYTIEQAVGYKQASIFYKDAVHMIVDIDTKKVITEILKDIGLNIGGAFSIPVVYIFKKSNTLCGYLLKNFSQQSYGISVLYMVYYQMFSLMTFITVAVKNVMNKTLRKSFMALILFLVFDLMVAIYNSFFSFRGFSYLEVVIVSVVFELMVVSNLFKTEDES